MPDGGLLGPMPSMSLASMLPIAAESLPPPAPGGGYNNICVPGRLTMSLNFCASDISTTCAAKSFTTLSQWGLSTCMTHFQS